MSFGGSKSTQTVVNEVPSYISGAHEANIQRASEIADQPYEAYGGKRLAVAGADGAAGRQLVRDATGIWRDEQHQAAGTASAAAMYLPEKAQYADVTAAELARDDVRNVGAHAINGGAIRDIGAGKLTDVDLSAYMSPYQDAVVDAARTDIERSGAVSDQQIRARLAAAGAFGGSRATLAQTENARNTGQTVAQTVAALRNQGYQNAQAGATADLNRRLAADQANQGKDLTVATSNQAAAQNADRANQAADITVGQGNQAARNDVGKFNAAQQLQAQISNRDAGMQAAALRLDASKVLSDLGGAQSNAAFRDAAALMGLDDTYRADEQQALDQAYAEWLDQKNYPIEGLNLKQSMLSGAPYSTSSTQPVYKNQGANALAGALGASKLFGELGWGKGLGAGVGGLLGLLG